MMVLLMCTIDYIVEDGDVIARHLEASDQMQRLFHMVNGFGYHMAPRLAKRVVDTLGMVSFFASQAKKKGSPIPDDEIEKMIVSDLALIEKMYPDFPNVIRVRRVTDPEESRRLREDVDKFIASQKVDHAPGEVHDNN